MKILPLYALGALALNLGMAHCHAQNAQIPGGPTPRSTVAPPASKPDPATRDEFVARYKTLEFGGDWTALHQLGRDWQAAHPEDADAFYAQGYASYMRGDLDSTILELDKFLAANPAEARNARDWANNARSIKRNFPDLSVKPLQLVTGDADLESAEWAKKSAALLAAKEYDEIERVAAQLQKSGAANIEGVPHLRAFFNGLFSGETKNFPALQARIAAWRAARPKSNLARLAALEMWTEQAYQARGTGYASTITPGMEARMGAALDKGAATLKTLPKNAVESPLFFDVVLRWGLFAGASREFFDKTFADGIKKFPNYLPLYTRRAHNLLPRWFGEPGEWEAMAKKRADQLGGEKGDVFYARIVWSLSQLVADLPKESKFSYARAKRGFEILQEIQPDSISLASARLDTAIESEDWKTAKQVLTAPQGDKLENSWWRWQTPRNIAVFPETRMWILSDETAK